MLGRFDFRKMAVRLTFLLIWTLSLLTTGMAEAQEFTAPSVVRAHDEATLSSIISGTVKALPFVEGSEFGAGDILVELDCAIYRSEADAARADSDGTTAKAAALEALFSRGGIGRVEVEVARAEAKAAKARVRTAEFRAESCQIPAPYDGRIAEHFVNRFEYVDPGQPVLSIVSSGSPSLEIIAPAEWLLWVEPGTKGYVELDAQREKHNFTVKEIGPVVDPVSRTVKLIAFFDMTADGVLPGMSGLVFLERGQ